MTPRYANICGTSNWIICRDLDKKIESSELTTIVMKCMTKAIKRYIGDKDE